ncbi:MAG: threonine synthase, partial [Planctomycetota bacterium]
HQTLAPAMDIQVASNFERYLYYKLDREPKRLQATMAEFSRTGSLQVEPTAEGAVDPCFEAGATDTDACLDAIRRHYEAEGYLLDPHTACGVAVAESLAADADDEPIICLATAHPAKFPDAIRRATGADVARHPRIDALMDKPTRCATLPDDTEAVRQFIADTAP